MMGTGHNIKAKWYSYNIIWLNKHKVIINDAVDHYSELEAIEVVEQSDNFECILWVGRYPLSKEQMIERRNLTGIEIT